MARKLKVVNVLNRQQWLALGIEERARRLRNQNILDNYGGSRTGSRKYKRNEVRISRALSNMQRKASKATKARGAVSG